MMNEAICVQCGAERKAGKSRCKNCGLRPTANQDVLIRSIYLSCDRYCWVPDEIERAALTEVWVAELPTLGERIRSGETLEFPHTELSKINSAASASEDVPLGRLALALLRIFWPLLAGIPVVWLLVWLLESRD
jgi:hypothetical protein